MPKVPSGSTNRNASDTLSLVPFGAGGVDQFTSAALLDPSVLRRGENIRSAQLVTSRRLGAQKVYRATDIGAARLFGADTKYASVPAASHLLIPKGGFGYVITIKMVPPGAGNTSYILSNRQPGQTYGVVWLTVNDGRQLIASVRWSNGTTTTLTSEPLVNGQVYNVAIIYNDPSGSITMYLDGAPALSGEIPVSASPGSGLQPAQTANINWYFGVEYDPSAVGVTANTAFLGEMDGFTLFTLAGNRPTSGDTTLLSTILKWSRCQWPAPEAPFVLAHYDFDEASGSVLYDRSRHMNHGTYVGASSTSTALAYSSHAMNHVGAFDTPLGKRVNLIGNSGRAVYEIVRQEA